MAYILIRVEDGAYVGKTPKGASYTFKLQEATVFSTRESAERDRCGNERIVPVADCLRGEKK